eukprot:187202-Prorocentrum_lima.AAC.1
MVGTCAAGTLLVCAARVAAHNRANGDSAATKIPAWRGRRRWQEPQCRGAPVVLAVLPVVLRPPGVRHGLGIDDWAVCVGEDVAQGGEAKSGGPVLAERLHGLVHLLVVKVGQTQAVRDVLMGIPQLVGAHLGAIFLRLVGRPGKARSLLRG